MIQLIKRMIFAWRYKRAVARACKYAKLYGRKYYVLYMGGKLKVVPKRNICELIHRHRFRKRPPLFGGITPLFKIRARLPVAALKERVAALFPCQCRVRPDGGIIDALKHRVGESEMLLALPADAALCQHVVVAADAQADAAVLLIGKPRVFQRVEVEVDHIIQCADGRFHRAFHIGLVLHRQITERQTRQVADHKLTWACGRHHHCVAVLRVHLSADMLDRRHVLCDLRAEIGAIDHSRVAVWVHTIYAVAVEGERRAGLHCRAKHQPHDVLDGDAALFDARVIDAVQIPLLPFRTPVILQCVALDREDLMRTHEMPRRVYVLLRQSPEEIRIAHGGKHIMCLHAVVAVVGAQLKEFRQIPVPCV